MNKFVQTNYNFFLFKCNWTLVQMNISNNEFVQTNNVFFCILVQMNISIKKFVQKS